MFRKNYRDDRLPQYYIITEEQLVTSRVGEFRKERTIPAQILPSRLLE
jgi:hypothetical protein